MKSARPRVVVRGGANTDPVVRVPRLPAAGWTIAGAGFHTLPGGKGANQAVALAARAHGGRRRRAFGGETRRSRRWRRWLGRSRRARSPMRANSTRAHGAE